MNTKIQALRHQVIVKEGDVISDDAPKTDSATSKGFQIQKNAESEKPNLSLRNMTRGEVKSVGPLANQDLKEKTVYFLKAGAKELNSELLILHENDILAIETEEK